MKRLTTDSPRDNFSTLLNLIFPKDGWSYIRDGEEGKSIIDFVLSICRDRKCGCADDEIMAADNERKDEMLCGCVFEPCPIADVYAALCGFSHLRSRLMIYEDACFDAEDKELVTPEMILKLRYGQMQETKHGRWIKSSIPDVFQCSYCKKPTKMDIYCNADTLRNYCPNCGARMDLEDENNEK